MFVYNKGLCPSNKNFTKGLSFLLLGIISMLRNSSDPIYGHLAWMQKLYRHSQKLSPNFQIKGVKIQGDSRPLVFIPEIQCLKMAILGWHGRWTLNPNLDIDNVLLL